ncbi:hypothetical protein QTP88_029702 [Uroleucon formosanum]
MVDASTDTLLTPSWWDSDRVVEARAASKRRLARKSTDATQPLARSGETEDDTAVDTDAGGNWAEVARRRRSRKNTVAAVASPPAARVPTKPASVAKKPPAILVKPCEGKSFADTVRAVRSCGFNVKDVGASLSMRETRDGSLLLELPKGGKSSAAAKTIAEALGTKLGDSVGRVSKLGVQVEIEVLDLDAVSSAAEVLEVPRASVPGGDDPTAVAEREAICDVRIWPGRGGQQVATAKMSRYAASVITEVPVGWTICRVRPRTRPLERCFRCQAFGHNARSCTAQDRSGACWRCGETGHPMKDCKAGEDSCLAYRPPDVCDAMISFLQINLNCNWSAEQLMAQTANETGADVLIVSEPATHYGDDGRWVFSTDRKAAVGIAQHSSLSHDGHGSGEGFAWLSFRELTVFSCYWRPGSTLPDYGEFLGNLEDAVRARGDSQIVLAGDFNGWNPRGCLLFDLAVSLGLILANQGVAPTFVREAATSIINFDPTRNELVFTRTVPEFTLEELGRASKRLTTRRAPGPSGIPNEVLRALLNTHPRKVLGLLNNCLRALTFPSRWKRARLVLLRKGPDKPPEAHLRTGPSVCWIPPANFWNASSCSDSRNTWTPTDAKDAPRLGYQYGFRKGMGTETAIAKVLELAELAATGPGQKDLCVLVALDVKNALNTLRWPVIDEALRRKKTPEYLVEMFRFWLSDRTLLTGEEMAPRSMTCGVPQDSVLGPALWNVAYDGLLGMRVPPGVHLVGFADDLAVIGRGLQLAHHKSEAVLLTNRRAFTPPRLEVSGHPIVITKSVRYLGMTLDQRLTFAPHVDTVAKKAARSAAALARLMPYIRGPDQSKRRLLNTVVDSQLLCAAPAWISRVAVVARTRASLVRPQRSAALTTIRAYRTVSDEAALVLASTVPADHLGLERMRIGKRLRAEPDPGEQQKSKASVRSEKRRLTLTRWQARWRTTTKGAWTRRAIPNLGRWVGRTVPWVPLTYHMTQALTGHGCFQWYLHRMGRAESPRCLLCACTSDTAEHTLFVCVRWEMFREELSSRLGHRPTVLDVQELVCGPEFEALPEDPVEKAETLREAEEKFRLFFQMVERIMTVKEQLERQRQTEEAARVPE